MKLCEILLSLAVSLPTITMAAEPVFVYKNVFQSYDDFDVCTILDKNNDGLCWDWRSSGGENYAYCLGTQEYLNANDWLITPPVPLRAGYSYRMEVDTRPLGDKEEKFECRWGDGYHVENLTRPAMVTTVMDGASGALRTYSGYRIDVTADGNYRFAYHMMSDPGSVGVAVYAIRVQELGKSSDLPVEQTPVFSETFDSATSFRPFTTYDMNGDGAVWSHNNNKRCAQYTYSSKNAADDWLVTPGIALQCGRDYKLNFSAETASMGERIEVRIGNSNKISDMETILVEPTDLTKKTKVTMGKDQFKVSRSGTYYIAFHAISDKDCDKIYVDDIVVSDIGANGDTEPTEPEPQTAVRIPYSADMTLPSTFAEWDVVDANYDGRTWKYDPIFNTTLYGYSKEKDADDWLISPFLDLERGKKYRLTVEAASRGREFPEKFEVRMGHGTEIETYTTTLIAPTEIIMGVGDPALKFQSDAFSVDKDGVANIGIHALSAANMSDLIVKSVLVEEINGAAPRAVTNLTAIPDPNGDLKATVTFTAPTHDYSGNTISTLTKIVVTRDGKEIKTLTNVQAGSNQIVVDEDAAIKHGVNQYTVTPYIDNYEGETAQLNLYIGSDVPVKLTGLKYEDTGNGVSLQWNEVSRVGQNGGTVYPAHVSYKIYEAVPEYTMGIMTGVRLYEIKTVKETSAFIDYPEISQGKHAEIHYAVCPVNEAGEGKAAYANMVKGRPYDVPFVESAADGVVTTFITVDTDCEYEESSLYISGNASDGDDGALAFVSYEGGKYIALFTGKINVKGVTEPILSFDARNAIGNNDLNVQVITPDYIHHDVKMITPGNEYSNYTFNLSDYKDCLWVRLIFAAEFPLYVDDLDGNELNVDNIRIYDKNSGIEAVGVEVLPLSGDIYSIDGRLLRRAGESTEGLKGIVISNGHKYILK